MKEKNYSVKLVNYRWYCHGQAAVKISQKKESLYFIKRFLIKTKSNLEIQLNKINTHTNKCVNFHIILILIVRQVRKVVVSFYTYRSPYNIFSIVIRKPFSLYLPSISLRCREQQSWFDISSCFPQFSALFFLARPRHT